MRLEEKKATEMPMMANDFLLKPVGRREVTDLSLGQG